MIDSSKVFKWKDATEFVRVLWETSRTEKIWEKIDQVKKREFLVEIRQRDRRRSGINMGGVVHRVTENDLSISYRVLHDWIERRIFLFNQTKKTRKWVRRKRREKIRRKMYSTFIYGHTVGVVVFVARRIDKLTPEPSFNSKLRSCVWVCFSGAKKKKKKKMDLFFGGSPVDYFYWEYFLLPTLACLDHKLSSLVLYQTSLIYIYSIYMIPEEA